MKKVENLLTGKGTAFWRDYTNPSNDLDTAYRGVRLVECFNFALSEVERIINEVENKREWQSDSFYLNEWLQELKGYRFNEHLTRAKPYLIDTAYKKGKKVLEQIEILIPRLEKEAWECDRMIFKNTRIIPYRPREIKEIFEFRYKDDLKKEKNKLNKKEMANTAKQLSTSVDTFKKYIDGLKRLNKHGEVPTFTIEEGKDKLVKYFDDAKLYYKMNGEKFLYLILEHIALTCAKMIANKRKINVDDFLDNVVVPLYTRKNADYGNSFYTTADEYGLGVCMARISDKLGRLKNAWNGKELKVSDEKVEDTLIDLLCYSVMTVLYIKEKK